MQMKRRQILKVSALATGCFAFDSLLGKLALAQQLNVEPHFFILFGVTPTMDCTLGLNPLTHAEYQTQQSDIFLEYSPSEIIKKGALQLGPSAAPLLAHASDIAIINGIIMRQDIGHTLEYISTGFGDRLMPDLATELSVTHTAGKKGLLTSVSNINGNREGLVSPLSTITSSLSNSVSSNETLIQSLLSSGENLTLKSELTAQENTLVNTSITSLEQQGFTNSQHNVTASLFQHGLAYQAFLSPISFPNLDTHNNHVSIHLDQQKIVWQEVADLFKLFKSIPFNSKSLFDHTTFMVCTDMSRTPFLNAGQGKDHNIYTNSVLLAGKGIRGGSVVGHSTVLKKNQNRRESMHIGLPIDFKTGTVIKTKPNDLKTIRNIYPENVIRTVADLFNAESIYPDRPQFLDTPKLPNLLKR